MNLTNLISTAGLIFAPWTVLKQKGVSVEYRTSFTQLQMSHFGTQVSLEVKDAQLSCNVSGPFARLFISHPNSDVGVVEIPQGVTNVEVSQGIEVVLLVSNNLNYLQSVQLPMTLQNLKQLSMESSIAFRTKIS